MMMKMTNPLTFGSLFAGIGGIDLGFECSGMVCSWQVEINQFCQSVLQKHWPDVPKYGDIYDVGKHNLSAVNVICGGFPCPAFSAMGKGGGFEQDPLFFQMVRVADELKPRWIVFENVERFRKWSSTLHSEVENLGYEWVDFLLDARDFGIPQARVRYFAVCVQRGVLPSSQHLWGFWRDKSPNFRGICSDFENREGWRSSTPRTKDDWRDILAHAYRGGNDYGIPNRMDRLNACGNAVVPQMAQFIGQSIIDCEKSIHEDD